MVVEQRVEAAVVTTDGIAQAVHTWVYAHEHCSSLSTVHLDDLLQRDYVHELRGELSLLCAAALVSAVNRRSVEDKHWIVIVPLGCSGTLQLDVPDWSQSITSDSREPPSIYLVPQKGIWRPLRIEEYHRPVQLPIDSSVIGDVYCSYRCFRTEEELRNGWEFDLSFVIERCPPP